MRTRVYTLLFIAFIVSCKAKDPTPEIQNSLITAMQKSLYNAINNDSTNLKYHVKSVVFYDDKEKNIYECEFTVNMKERAFDTTGIMRANISKDFQKVTRFQ